MQEGWGKSREQSICSHLHQAKVVLQRQSLRNNESYTQEVICVTAPILPRSHSLGGRGAGQELCGGWGSGTNSLQPRGCLGVPALDCRSAASESPAATVQPSRSPHSCSGHFLQEALPDSLVGLSTSSGVPEILMFPAVDYNRLFQGAI